MYAHMHTQTQCHTWLSHASIHTTHKFHEFYLKLLWAKQNVSFEQYCILDTHTYCPQAWSNAGIKGRNSYRQNVCYIQHAVAKQRQCAVYAIHKAIIW